MWIMGRNDFDAYRRRLTDNANLFVEMQAGLFPDQQTYQCLEPQQARTLPDTGFHFAAWMA